MASNGKLIKASNQYRPASNIVIGGADLSDLPNKQDIINEHLLIKPSKKQKILLIKPMRSPNKQN
jgi:hypothetical protein